MARRLMALLVGSLVALPAGAQDGAVYKWVDKEGHIHITTTPPPAGAGEVPVRKPVERFVYEWRAPDGKVHVTQKAPPPEGKLLAKQDDPRPPDDDGEGGAKKKRRALSGEELPVEALRQPGVVGQRAPDLVFFNGIGDEVSLAELRGRVVWIAFASRHANDALAEVDVMRAVGEQVDDDHAFLFVVGASGDVKDAKKLAQELGLPPDLVLVGTPDSFPFGPVPHNVFIDRAGRIVKLHTGKLGDVEARAALDSLGR